MTQICVTLCEPTSGAAIDRMVELAPLADAFEIRGDALREPDLLTILRAKTRPLIFACRARKDGGVADLPPERRRLLLLEAAKRGYDYVDVEVDSGFTDVMIEKAGRGLIVSHHDFEGLPAELDLLYVRMTALGADIAKIAVTPRSFEDVVKLWEFADRVRRMGGPPLIPIAMGPLGLFTRILGGKVGAPFTYAAPLEGREAAPGQLPALDLSTLYRVRTIGAATRVFGILGSDVTHSLSPLLHNNAFAARGLDAVYVPLQAEALAPFLRCLPVLELSGFSVTMPFKVEMLGCVHEVEEGAALAGSVNTVVVREGGLLSGSTTDGRGVAVPLKQRLDVRGRAVIIVGAGGAARAVANYLVRRGARVTLFARRDDQAASAAAATGASYAPLATLGATAWDVLINATPVGSAPAVDQTPVPAASLRPGAVVFDMVYRPLETRLLREARAAGCVAIDGLEMLVAQAAAQFETWTGLEAPVDLMRDAARDRIAREARSLDARQAGN